MKAFQIFRAGKHTTADGTTITFSEEDISGMVKAYDPKISEAPIVIGHPSDNSPAYGWVASLSEAGGIVQAKPHQITEEFSDWVKAGHYKKRSASLYPPDHPNNPAPGKYYLRHVGFLGAQPPAIKGMPDAQFKDTQGILEFASTQHTAGMVARLFRGLRDWLIDEKDVETADNILPNWTIDELEAESRIPDPEPASAPEPTPNPAYSEGGTQPNGETQMNQAELEKAKADLKVAQDELKKSQDKLAADTAAFAESQAAIKRKARAAEIGNYLDGLVAQRKLIPAMKAGLALFMAQVDHETVVEFGETEADKKTPDAFLRQFLESLPPIKVGPGDLAQQNGDELNPDIMASARDLSNRAQLYMEKQKQAGNVIRIEDAVSAVQQGLDVQQ